MNKLYFVLSTAIYLLEVDAEEDPHNNWHEWNVEPETAGLQAIRCYHI